MWQGTYGQNFHRSFTYDALNRISGMSDSFTTASCLGLTWTYDAWGNRTNQSVTSGSCPAPSAGATIQNRLAGYGYDAAGNMTSDGSHTYTYDAENRLIAVDGGNTAKYTYDAEGNRIQTVSGSVINQYVFGTGGEVLHEVGGTGTFNVHYLYFGGQLAAQMKNSTTYFIHTDHLGSTRVVTNLSGGVFDSMDYLPFGEQIAGDTGTSHKFTGKERDAESGLDNFGARYDSSTLGRFMTPDWAAKPTTVPYASFGDPQTLNLYSYVENAPVNRADADGHTGLGAADAGWVSAPEVLKGSAYGSPADETSVTDFDSSLNSQSDVSQQQVQQQQASTASTAPLTLPTPLVLPALGEVVQDLLTTAATPLIVLGYLISPGTTGTSANDTIRYGPPPSASQQGTINNGPINATNVPKSTLPRDPAGNYTPHPDAEGPHSTLGTRVGHDGVPYTQGATFGANGEFKGRTDVTNHGRADHANPHFHPATGPASTRPGPGEPIPQN